MADRNLLKEAIAEAKAVKEVAIANAKAALEEALTPQLQSMLAEKIAEMDAEEVTEEETMAEIDREIAEMDDDVKEGADDVTEEVSLEEILREIEALEEGDDEVTEAEETTEGEEVTEEEEVTEAKDAEEELDLEDMSEEDLKDLIEDVIADMIEDGELVPGPNAEAEEGEDAEGEGEDEEVEVEDDLAEADKDMVNEGEEVTEEEDVTEGDEPIDEAIAGEVVNVAVQSADAIALIVGGILGLGATAVAATMADAEAREEIMGYFADMKNAGKAKAQELGAKINDAVARVVGDKTVKVDDDSAVSEMEDTIAELRQELAESNLLNSKLLYANKIFKSRNLNEAQKINVLKTFDKADSVKEVKLVFESLNESLTTKKSIVRENLGSASRSAGAAPVKNENATSTPDADPFARMKKLAGL